MTTTATPFTPAELAAATTEAIRRRPSFEDGFRSAQELLEQGYRQHPDGIYFKDGRSVTLPNGECRGCGPALTCVHELAVRILAVAEDQRGASCAS